MTDPLSVPHAFPHYREPVTYVTVGDQLRPWEYNGWKPESLSWKQSCYIHTGLSGPLTHIDGPEADAFIAQLCTNSLKSFPRCPACRACGRKIVATRGKQRLR